MGFVYRYPRPSLTADVMLFDAAKREVLLIRRGNDPFRGSWAFAGGFFDMEDVNIEHTASRELMEETGLTDIELKLFCVASRTDRDPRGRTVSVIFYGIVDRDALSPKGGDDATEVKWFPLENLPQLAFDHGEILEKAKKELFK